MLEADRLPMPLTYARIMLRELGTSATRRRRLLHATRISEADLGDPVAEATLGDFFTMFDNARALCDPGWSLALAERFDLAAQGALGFAMACAPTLGDSFDVMARYGHVRAPWFRLRVLGGRQRWGVRILRQFPVPEHIDVPMLESVLLSGQNLVESVLGRPMVEASFHFDYPPPPWHERYAAHFHGRVVFEAGESGLSMPADWRNTPCLLADAGMYQAALSRLETDRRRLDAGEFLTVRIAMLLAASGDAGLDLKTVAERLNVSSRTLMRRLRAAGTSFRALLDRHRMQRARQLLEDPGYSVSEIAYRLGYSDPANFTRVFKRWFGRVPSALRPRSGA